MVDNWQTRRLGDFAERIRDINDTGLKLEPLSVTKGEGVVLQSSRFSKRIATDLRKYQIAQRGEFIFDPMSLYYGAIGRFDVAERGVVSPDYVVFRVDHSVDPDYFLALVRSPRMWRRFESLSEVGNRSGKRRRLYWSGFRDIDVPFPPLAEQRRIAAILSSVDEAIEKKQAVINQVQTVKKGLMQELFAKGLPGRHKTFKHTEIGRIPEAWSVRRLTDCLNEPIRNGYSPVCPAEPTGAWILHLGAVTPDGYDRCAVKPAPRNDSKVEATLLRAGDLLVSRSNTRARVGLAGIYDGSPEPCSYPDLLMRVRARQEDLEAEFLQAWILGPFGRGYMEANARGTSASMVKINRAILGDMPVPLPPIDEQTSIVSSLATVESYRTAHREELEALVTLKSALQSLLLTGELRVRPDTTPTPEPS